MANQSPPSNPATPPGLPETEVLHEHDDGEVVMAFFRRHGLWIFFVVIAAALFLGFGAYQEQQEKQLNEKVTLALEDILKDFHQDPLAKRKLIEETLAHSEFQTAALKPWLEFLLIRTYIEEDQRQLIANGTSPQESLKRIDAFIKDYRHPQLTPFAYLSKAVLLEDLGKLEESQATLAELNQYPLSVAHRISQKIMSSSSQKERHELWQQYLSHQTP